MPKNLFSTLLVPPPEKALDRKAALSWLTHNLPEYESLAAYLLRRLLQDLEVDTPVDAKLGKVQFRAAALYLLQRDVQTMAWACSGVLGGLPPVVIKQGREVEGIEDFQGTIVSALRLLVAEAGVVDPASGAFRELSAALAQWQARESEAAGGVIRRRVGGRMRAVLLVCVLLAGCAPQAPRHHWSELRLNLYRADRHECLHEALADGGGVRWMEDRLEMRCMKRHGWWIGPEYCGRFGYPTETAPGVCTSRPPAS